jgi:hypothetical protein
MTGASRRLCRALVREVQAETIINAPPEVVWQILTDFASYTAWNPFILSIQGKPRVGTRLEVVMNPPGRGKLTFRPKVLRVSRNREIRWIGRVVIAGLFDGEHRFTIVPEGEAGVRFIQSEIFTGLLVPLLDLFGAFRTTRLGFLLMNQALKERAERSVIKAPAQGEPPS